MEKELIRTLRLNGTTLRIFDIFIRDSQGKNIVVCEFKVGRKVIFSGCEFHCSPLHAIDSLQTAFSILSFIILRPGDTDKEYFAEYNEEQMAWANSGKCEYLSCLVGDWKKKNQKRNRRN